MKQNFRFRAEREIYFRNSIIHFSWFLVLVVLFLFMDNNFIKKYGYCAMVETRLKTGWIYFF